MISRLEQPVQIRKLTGQSKQVIMLSDHSYTESDAHCTGTAGLNRFPPAPDKRYTPLQLIKSGNAPEP